MPGECKEHEGVGVGGDALTPFDPRSVMNYCNVKYNTGQLSERDIAALQLMYGPAFVWLAYADKARQSIVYIYFDVTDPNTGAKSTIQGTGFVVSPEGYVLTASHLLREWLNQTATDQLLNPIKGTLRDKPGFETESPFNLQIVELSDPNIEDVALLKLPHPTAQPYPTAAICLRNAETTKLGDDLVAFGFPLGQNFQPVSATIGTQNAPGGRWAAAGPFTEGMSGGPVYNSKGSVVGIVGGGSESGGAANWITPLRYAARLLVSSAFEENCETAEEPINSIAQYGFVSKNNSFSELPSEQVRLFLALANTGRISVTRFQNSDINSIEEIFRRRHLYYGATGTFPVELDSLACDLNTHLCKRPLVSAGYKVSTASHIWGTLPSRGEWSDIKNKELLIPDLLLKPVISWRFTQKKSGEDLAELVVQKRAGCDSFDDDCRLQILKRNDKGGNDIFNTNFSGGLSLPLLLVRANCKHLVLGGRWAEQFWASPKNFCGPARGPIRPHSTQPLRFLHCS